jgi:hypothetical protein
MLSYPYKFIWSPNLWLGSISWIFILMVWANVSVLFMNHEFCKLQKSTHPKDRQNPRSDMTAKGIIKLGTTTLWHEVQSKPCQLPTLNAAEMLTVPKQQWSSHAGKEIPSCAYKWTWSQLSDWIALVEFYLNAVAQVYCSWIIWVEEQAE